jgi:hypothetical protein
VRSGGATPVGVAAATRYFPASCDW